MQDEQSLVQRAQQLDQAAFAKIYEEHFDKVYRYVALRIGDRMEAEDITQQVFLNALKAIHSFKWQGVPFSAWLFRIAHNQVVDYLRKRTRQATAPLDDVLTSTDPEPAEIAEQNINIEHINQAAQGLTELQREVISLRFASELSVTEAARVMGKSESAVKALQHSAIRALRRALKVTPDEIR